LQSFCSLYTVPSRLYNYIMANTASTDGSFSLFYQKGWAWLTVYPPEGKGRPVYPEEVENKMKILRMPKVPPRQIRDCIEASSGEPQRLVEWPDGDRLVSTIHVQVDQAAMNARLTVDAPKKGAAPPTADEIIDTLRRQRTGHTSYPGDKSQGGVDEQRSTRSY